MVSPTSPTTSKPKPQSLAVCIGGEWFEKNIASKTQSEGTRESISRGLLAYNASKPFKSRKRLAKLKARMEKEALKKPMGEDDYRFRNEPLVQAWLNRLRSVPPNTYTARINPIDHGIFDQSPKNYYLERLPCHRTYMNGLRFYSEWTSISKFKRNLIFNGDLDIDIKSFHFNLFLALCRKRFDRVDQETGEILANQIDRILHGMSLGDYFKDFSWEKWLWKPLINATIHGLSPKKLRTAVAEFTRSEEVPPIFAAITKYLYVLQTQDIESGLGETLRFRHRLWTNQDNWTLLFNSWELKIKTGIAEIPNCYGRIGLDSHDGFIFCLSKDRYRRTVENRLQSNMTQFNLEEGFFFELSIEPVRAMDFAEVENKKKSDDVVQFLKALKVKVFDDQDQSFAGNVDDLIRSGLEDFRLADSYRSDWRNCEGEEKESIPLITLGTEF